MTAEELAYLVNRRRRYRKREGTPVSRLQIHSRTRSHPSQFQLCGSLIRLTHGHGVLTSMSHPGTTDSIAELRRQGFEGFSTIGDLYVAGRTGIPDEPGVYLVLRTEVSPPEFLVEGTGGRFKGKNPNVPLSDLRREWVQGALVVYVGQTGSGGRATLRRRIARMLRFGHGASVGHWGGRLIWQLKGSERLLVCWKPIAEPAPRKVESALIRSFKSMHGGKRPFANLRD